MRIAVVAANGKAGRLIVKEAVGHGMDVTAVVRGENKTEAGKAIVKDAMELTTEDLAGFDAVVDAVGGWTAEAARAVPDVAEHLADALSGAETRLLVVGGAGSLFVDPEHTKTVVDVTPFPDEVMPVLNAHKDALEMLRGRDDVRWTYVSPAGDFQADGERTGEYQLGGEELVLNAAGESTVSYADYAIAMVDELESGDHVRQRISVVSK